MKKWKDWSGIQKLWLWLGVGFVLLMGGAIYEDPSHHRVCQILFYIIFSYAQWQYDEVKQLKNKIKNKNESN